MFKYQSVILLYDNQGAIMLTKNSIHYAKTKYIDVQLHFIRDHVEKSIINIKYCFIKVMLTDFMTKGLVCERHGRLLELMGVGTCKIANTTSSSSEKISESDKDSSMK